MLNLTQNDTHLIRESWADVVPIADTAATLFYDRLFEIAPEVKPLFPGDMAEQGRKLMKTLIIVVNGLDKLPTILPAASVLAKRHVTYGVKPSHYTPVGAALLWALQRGLGSDWTPELEGAWSAAYTTLANFMIGEAYGRQAAAQ